MYSFRCPSSSLFRFSSDISVVLLIHGTLGWVPGCPVIHRVVGTPEEVLVLGCGKGDIRLDNGLDVNGGTSLPTMRVGGQRIDSEGVKALISVHMMDGRMSVDGRAC